jgi:hypothetical protein
MKRVLCLLLVFAFVLPVSGQVERRGSQPELTRHRVSSLMPGSILTYLLQEFEGTAFPPTGWTLEGSGSSVWARSTRASGYGIGAASALANFYSIGSGVTFSLITPQFDVSGAGDSLKFDHAYATYTTENDQLQISTSTNGGTSWSVLITLAGGVSGPLVTAPPTTSVFVPTASQWATKKFALPVGTNKIKFTGISAYGNCLYVDNIVVGTPFPNDIGVVSIDEPRSNIAPGTVAPKATIKNYGLLAQTAPVTLTITPGGYTSTQNVTSLAPGATQQLTFANWSAGIGSYTVRVTAQLAADQNRSNDTLTSFHIVSDVNRGVLLEFCTGTWCQWCPCGDLTAEALEHTYSNLVVLAYHGPAGSASDPWTTFNGNSIISALGFSGYPTANFDRQNTPGDYTTWTGFCQNRYNNFSPTPISIVVTSHSYNAATRQLDLTLQIRSNCTLTSQYKVNYVITENNLIYPQTGNSTCPGSSTWVHDWVVRDMVNGATGENVNTGTWTSGQAITKTISTTLNAAWVAANCELNVFVYKDGVPLSNAEVQNAIVRPVIPTSVEIAATGIPSGFALAQNYPNPFNPTTNITFALPKEGFVSLKVYDITGREVLTGVNEVLKPGYYNTHIDASGLSSGMYFYTLTANGFTATKKMTLVR